MRIASRELLVGFLLVLAFMASGCQPVQPVPDSSATAASQTTVESEVVSGTATLSESATVSAGTPATGSASIPGSVAATVTVTNGTAASITASVTETQNVSVSVLTTATQASTSPQPVATADPGVWAAGLAVYRAQYCGVCHTLDAAETRGTFGPPHNGMDATAATRLADGSYHGAATTPAEYIRESIVDPQVFIVPGYATTSHRMPSYTHLDAASLDALVAFMLAQ